MKKLSLTGTLLLGCALALGACATGDDLDDDGIATATFAAAGDCAAVHIITARASTEAPGEGILSALVDQIIDQSNQSITRAAVNYPATLNNYASSQAQGVTAMKNML